MELALAAWVGYAFYSIAKHIHDPTRVERAVVDALRAWAGTMATDVKVLLIPHCIFH